MIVNKRFLALTLSTALAATLLTGCGTGNTASSGNTAEQAQSSAEAGSTSDYKGSTVIGKVTAVDGNTITLSIGGGPGGPGGSQKEGKGRPDGNKGTDSTDNQSGTDTNTPPELPDNNGDNQTPPELPDNNGDNQTPPDMNSADGNTSTDSNDTNDSSSSSDKKDTDKKNADKKHESKTVTITIDDESVLNDISLSDITEGTRLTVTFDDNGNVTSVAKASEDFGPGGKGERPDGKGKADDNGRPDGNGKADGNETVSSE